MTLDPLGGTPPAAQPAPASPARGLVANLASPTTLTTVVGALIAIAIGAADTWYFQQMSYDQALIWAGLGALLGVNPLPRSV